MPIIRATAALCIVAALAQAGCSERPQSSAARGSDATLLVSAVRDTLRARSGYVLAQPLWTSVDRDGNYVIADGSDKSLKRYSAAGAEMAPVGRAGGGPGEFQALLSGGVIGDSLFAYDFAGTRLSLFGGSGAYARSFALWQPGDPMPSAVRAVDDSLFLVVAFPLSSPTRDLLRLVRADGSVKSTFFNRRAYFEPESPDLLQSSVVVADGADGVVFAGLMGGDSLFAYDYSGKLLGSGPVLLPDGRKPPTFRALIENNGGSRFLPDRTLVTEGNPALVMLTALPGGRAVTQMMELDYGIQGLLDRTDGGTFAAVTVDRASGSVAVSGHREIPAGLQGRDRSGGAILVRYLGEDFEEVEVSELRIEAGGAR